MSGQSGKSEALLDLIGHRLDTSPVPILYVGPTKAFITEQFEPRIVDLLENTPLRRKTFFGHGSTKTKKIVSGVRLRLAHGGSSSALKSDPFGFALTDEADELLANVKNAGDPIELIDVRGDTYADFCHGIVSTPSSGVAETVFDEVAGLEFWASSEEAVVESKIWQLFLSGTMHHWAWPCPHCQQYFIPRFKCLAWEKRKRPDGHEMPSDPVTAAKTAHLVCPNNGCVIHDESKAWMNERGVYVAPGQMVTEDGDVVGDPPDSWTFSMWTSGLASPFVSWGERAARYVQAARSKNQEAIKAVVNGGFAELYAPGGGEVPESSEVKELRRDYRSGSVPRGANVLILTCDVQKDRIPYVVRAWGHKGTSYLVEAGELFGATEGEDVWADLDRLRSTTYGDGVPIRFTLIDAGYRPGKKTVLPVHRVYEYARRFPNSVRAIRGASNPMRKPILTNKIDITLYGREFKQGLSLSTLDTDFFKSWVHERIRWPADQPGSWNLPEDISADYCQQMVSEARLKTPSGKVKWVQRSKENHFFDCESLQAAAAMMLNLLNLSSMPDGSAQKAPRPAPTEAARDRQASEQQQQSRPSRRAGWIDDGSIW